MPSKADWSALAGAIAGSVHLPGSPEYELVRAPAMARFADVGPTAIVRCQAPEDVVEALGIARRFGLALAVRSGGHCFEGRSSTAGMLIDLGPMASISLSDEAVTVGAGVKLGALYDALDRHGRTIAAGCGPSVGIAGLTLGGGIGILGRSHGLTSDGLLAAEVVLADGRVVRCDDDRHADLFWALRGAGGLRFGVVTGLAFRTLPAPDATAFELRWPQGAAAAIVDAWQHCAPEEAPDGLAASLLVTAGADPERPLDVRVFGAAVGSESAAHDALDPLVLRSGVDPARASLRQSSYRRTKGHLAELDAGSTAKPEPGHVFAKSEFFRSALPGDAVAALVGHLSDGRTRGQARELDFTPWGGAYNRVEPDATAFVHRAERFLLKHEAVIDASEARSGEPAARAWLSRSWALAHPAGTGGAYANFPDPDLSAWHRAYHGANLERLLRTKARYDPDGVFSGPLGDQPAGRSP